MKNNQLVIIGGGASIKEGISKGLWDKLKDNFVFGLNYSYNHFPNPTAQIFVDNKFYEEKVGELKKLPLVIGKWNSNVIKLIKKEKINNTILLKAVSQYYRNIIHGVYKSSLCGIFALTLAIYLLDEEGEIYLLGYDYSGQGKDKKGKAITHYYQGEPSLRHRGWSKTNYYDTRDRAKRDFEPYLKEKKIKIYNVSINSHIPTFPKITYDEFFNRLATRPQNQDQLRSWIKTQLKNVEKK